MRDITGILFPDSVNELLAVCKAEGQRVVLSTAPGGECPNCGDMKYLNLDVINAGPSQNPYAPSQVSLLVNNQWYLGKRHQFPCPMCNADNRAMIEALWETSGLESAERQWHVDHIASMDGKELALEAARKILAQTPRPVGWSVVYGSYGVGKSGLMKSLVASFIRAGVSAKYITAFDILEEIKTTFRHNAGEATDEAYLRYASYKFLAIDEIDIAPEKDWSYQALRSIIDKRYNARHRFATMMATNADPEVMGEPWGYLISRMRDGLRVPMGGQDMRGQRLPRLVAGDLNDLSRVMRGEATHGFRTDYTEAQDEHLQAG